MAAAVPAHRPTNSSRQRKAQAISPSTHAADNSAAPHLTIVGAGLSGLTAALYALGAGFRVTVLDRESFVGGRCASEPVTVDVNGQPLTAVFDTGATVWTMPSLVDDALAAVGLYTRDIDPSFSACPITPTYRAEFATRGGLDVYSDEDTMSSELERFGADRTAITGYRKLRVWLQRLFDAAFDNFMSRSFDRVTDLFTGPGALRDLTTLARLGAFGALQPKIQAFLGDDELSRVFSFQALYAGVPPAKARAVYGCIAHMDTSMGVYYPTSTKFGSEMGAIPELLAEAVRRAGGTIELGVNVTGLKLDAEGRVREIATDTGDRATDAIICTTDLPVVKDWLNDALPATGNTANSRGLLDVVKRKWKQRRLVPLRFSPSAVVAHGLIPASATESWPKRHHLISFGDKWDETFQEISASSGGKLMSDPSLLITRPAVSSPERLVRDENGQLWEPVSVLAPCPNLASAELDWPTMAESYVDQLAGELERRGLTGISTQWHVGRIDTPKQWLDRGMGVGSPFGLAHLFRQTGPFRPRNFSPAMPENLVLAGSTTVPGVGVPTVMISGRLAAQRFADPTASTDAGR
ncbi:MAG: phytoene desaturase family protein [Corynebacterium sp.]|uniref:phytoene desaturase family protein n=1 Tax=Corynebacterium sp. TaxID=1720 RepID=UPI0026DD96C9|nr:phytoene desaturase family protein [Corynebacterium sp.]MDO5029657.1 phytoene desaturase family protein [Corynebacterium sp.]